MRKRKIIEHDNDDQERKTVRVNAPPYWDRGIPADVESLFGSYLGFRELERMGGPTPPKEWAHCTNEQ